MATRYTARSPNTRDRILSAAAEEFGARGFAATTVDRIARRARVNKARASLPPILLTRWLRSWNCAVNRCP